MENVNNVYVNLHSKPTNVVVNVDQLYINLTPACLTLTTIQQNKKKLAKLKDAQKEETVVREELKRIGAENEMLLSSINNLSNKDVSKDLLKAQKLLLEQHTEKIEKLVSEKLGGIDPKSHALKIAILKLNRLLEDEQKQKKVVEEDVKKLEAQILASQTLIVTEPERNCCNCLLSFLESKNNDSSCIYHSEFVKCDIKACKYSKYYTHFFSYTSPSDYQSLVSNCFQTGKLLICI
eukprot:TRINITY_DN3819_c0_g1_i1.p1 TRINITY_DN3819_c0_g1~~TRINITY_DN3819_c0_g1_i1.p1  ORF type:complete len:236 (-),score=27.24 TRINITY_DN3819_c0_g1_i1:235-942(-)